MCITSSVKCASQLSCSDYLYCNSISYKHCHDRITDWPAFSEPSHSRTASLSESSLPWPSAHPHSSWSAQLYFISGYWSFPNDSTMLSLLTSFFGQSSLLPLACIFWHPQARFRFLWGQAHSHFVASRDCFWFESAAELFYRTDYISEPIPQSSFEVFVTRSSCWLKIFKWDHIKE